MEYSQSKKALIYSYRALASLLVFIPLILNIIIESSIVTSLIYSPLFSLLLAFFLVYLDKKINVLLFNHYKNDMLPISEHSKVGCIWR